MGGYATNHTRLETRGPGEAPILPLQRLAPRARSQPGAHSTGSGSKDSRGDHSKAAGSWTHCDLANPLGLWRRRPGLCLVRRGSPGGTTGLSNRSGGQGRGPGLLAASGGGQTLDGSAADPGGPQGEGYEANQPRKHPAVSKKNVCKPWRKVMWCIGRITTEYRERMYDLLGLYAKPYDATEPVICLDEK